MLLLDVFANFLLIIYFRANNNNDLTFIQLFINTQHKIDDDVVGENEGNEDKTTEQRNGKWVGGNVPRHCVGLAATLSLANAESSYMRKKHRYVSSILTLEAGT